MRKKQNFKVILFLLLGVIIVSCVDDYEPINNKIKNRETSNFKTTKITLKDVKQNSIAFSKLTNPKKDKSIGKLNHKIINDTINNFSIDTEIGTFIESDNYHSYTFKVVRPNGSPFLLENLVVSKEGTNDYETYLYQYDITEQELQMVKEGVQINLSNKISILTIENTNIVTDLAAKEYPCFVQVTSYVQGQSCPNGHTWGQICEYYGQSYGPTAGYYITESILSVCNDSSGSGGNSNSNPTDPGQTYGSGGGSTTTVTTPTFEPCETCPEFDSGTVAVTPCESLNKLAETTDQNINPSLQFLKDKLDSGVTTEWGVQFNYNVDVSPAVASNQTIVGGSNSVDFALNWNQRGSAHLHTTAGYGMFSWGDVNSLAGFYDYASPLNQPYVTSIMVCNNLIPTTNTIDNYNVYAIKVDNYTSLSNAINNTLNNPDYNGLTLEEKIKKLLKKQANLFKAAGENNLEKSFLQQFASYGISLYKKKPPINSASTENWVKLTINPLTNTITETPC
jgi:hypothetical protein